MSGKVTRATVGNLEPEQFALAVSGRRLADMTKYAAHLVLVDGKSATVAADMSGLRVQAVSRAVLSIVRKMVVAGGRCHACGQRVKSKGHAREGKRSGKVRKQDADGRIQAADAEREGGARGAQSVVQ
jgi:tRNA(Ile2) C34 agmatinyltransferase TiaS